MDLEAAEMNEGVMCATKRNELPAGNVGVLALKIDIPNCTKHVPRRYEHGQANEVKWSGNGDGMNEAAAEDKGGCRERKRRK